ncbi:MAG: ABC transporter permease [Ilumatobacteraceae bacterium]
MLRFTLRRIGLALITLLILVVIIFLLTRVFPSDPARQLAGPFAPQERVDQITEENGFDDPLLTQLGDLLRSVVTFDYGESLSSPGESVISLVGDALVNSAKLVAFALVLTLPIAIIGGIIAARRKDTIIDRTIVTLGLASASIPEFVSGVLLQYIFGVQLGWFPAIATFPDDAGILTQLNHLVLPAVAIVIVYFGYIARITRAGTIAALESDYTRTAYMKGLTTNQVMRKHVLRNSLQPTVAVTGTQIGYLFGGLVGLEIVFNYPGLGRLTFTAATKADFPLLTACVMTVAIIFMITTLAADLIIAWMNPRARLQLGD